MQKAVSRSMWYQHWEARNRVATNTASASTKVDLSCDRSPRSVADSESEYASDVDIVNQLGDDFVKILMITRKVKK